MKHDIDKLVTDICTAYPELSQEAGLVRTIVVELLANKPVVTVDETFKARLRNELMARANNQPKSKMVLPWWILYTVPVGVTAILLLVVYPNQTTAPQPSVTTDSVHPTGSSLKMGEEATSDMWSTNMGDGGEGVETSVSQSDFFTATFHPDGQSIKVTYAMLNQPGFIVVSGPEGIVATSSLLSPGEHMGIEIRVSRLVQSGVTYFATLHYDNGDDVFTEEFDFVAFDQSGQTVQIPMVAP